MKHNRFIIKTDCLFYRGEKPCKYYLEKEVLCGNCPYYKKMNKKVITDRKKILCRFIDYQNAFSANKNTKLKKICFKILIIKLGAPGDVLRTTPILKTLKERHPSCHITWVTKKESVELLENNYFIDKIMQADFGDAEKVLAEKYDLLLSLDKDKFAIALALAVKARKKMGFRMDRFGALNIFNKKSLYALRLGIDNKLKYIHNKKTYQKIIYEMSELKASYGSYILELNENYPHHAGKILYKFGIRPFHAVVGLNTGAGKVFLTKRWPLNNFLELSRMLSKIDNVKVVLLGGPSESRLNKEIAGKAKGKALNIGTHYSKKQFTGIIDNCDIIVTSDTLCMHLGIARKKKLIVLFGPTAEREVDLYGLGKKIYTGLSCSPCYKSRCPDTQCMKSISSEMAFKEIKKYL